MGKLFRFGLGDRPIKVEKNKKAFGLPFHENSEIDGNGKKARKFWEGRGKSDKDSNGD